MLSWCQIEALCHNILYGLIKFRTHSMLSRTIMPDSALSMHILVCGLLSGAALAPESHSDD